MPKLTNPRHEHFAQLLARGAAQDAAYAEVGYKPSRPHASRLATYGNVRARVAELQQRSVDRHDVTVESLTRELDEARDIAKEQNNAAGMTAATMGKAKLHGLETGPRQNNRAPLEDVSDDELAVTIERLAAEAGISLGAGRKGSPTTH